MKIVIISGSARTNSQSIRIAAWIERHLRSQHETTVLDLSEVYVPEDPSRLWSKKSDEYARFVVTKQMLAEAEALVVVSPEWSGMTPGKLISLFQAIDAAGDHVVAHVPALMVTNSNARGGAYPASILQGYAAKNSHLLWIPEHIIIRFNETMLQEDPGDDDAYIQARLLAGLTLLTQYAEALTPHRATIRAHLKDYPNGM